MILIVSTYRDVHAVSVQWALRRMGVECKILDLFWAVADGFLTVDVQAGTLRWLCPRTKEIEFVDVRDIRCVWMRRDNREFDLARVHALDRQIVQGELMSAARNIEAFLQASAHCVNSRFSLGVSDQKLVQLREADAAGFIVPRTVMTNNAKEVRRFFDRNEATLFKPFHQNAWNAQTDSGNYAQRAEQITSADLDNPAPIELCPGIYQPLVEKSHELRVTICGDDLVAARLESQYDAVTATDWRHDYTKQMPIHPAELASELVACTRSLMEKLQLRFGCMDIIVTKDQKYVFLEINQQGQFLWLEFRNPRIKLLQRVSQFLCREAGVSFRPTDVSIQQYVESESYPDDMELRSRYFAVDKAAAES